MTYCSPMWGLALLLMVAVPCYTHRTPASIIQYNGYPAEVHNVTTKDGYILQLDRIPRPGARVVFLANQMAGSAASYLVLGKGKALAFLLYDAGFDVWLGNFRGTPFSLNHVHLKSSDDAFWKFGWHENGALDNPAMLEYVLARSGQRDLVFGAHSMGGTSFFVMASERPDLAARVRAAFLFAPAVFMTRTKDEHLLAVEPIVNITQAASERLHEHRRPTQLLEKVADELCTGATSAATATSRRQFCDIAGRAAGPHRFGYTSPLYFADGATVRQVLHTAQLAGSQRPAFRQYDYGSEAANVAQYGSPVPPDYRLDTITTPVYLYNGKGDLTCTPADQVLLKSRLRNVRRFFLSPNDAFGHYNFVRDRDIVKDMWQFVLADMKPFAKQSLLKKSISILRNFMKQFTKTFW
ncbi:lipase 3-like [Thrips palmi]|uniref:Lipase n=1 Tax=Thrips palmi TaxID=161013 RepID=A0A6P8YCA1_THRPL|nr:lipase 3-like [Thrips palmi]